MATSRWIAYQCIISAWILYQHKSWWWPQVLVCNGLLLHATSQNHVQVFNELEVKISCSDRLTPIKARGSWRKQGFYGLYRDTIGATEACPNMRAANQQHCYNSPAQPSRLDACQAGHLLHDLPLGCRPQWWQRAVTGAWLPYSDDLQWLPAQSLAERP